MGSTKVLAWGEFSSSLAAAVQALHGHEELVDVTLAADGRSFPAHKLVLSAASPLLMQLLKNSGCQHPVVLLAGITATDLEALLQFVYQGEVSVNPNQLPSLIQAADCLDIRAFLSTALPEELYNQSLKVDESHAVASPHSCRSMPSPSSSPTRKRKRRQKRTMPMPGHSNLLASHSIECQTDSYDENDIDSHHLCVANVSTGETSESETTKDESIVCIDGQMTNFKRMPSDQPAECPVCGAFIKQSRNLKRHIEIKHRDAHFQFTTIRKKRRKSDPAASQLSEGNRENSDPTAGAGTDSTQPEPTSPKSHNQTNLTDLQPMRWYPAPLWTTSSTVPGTSSDSSLYYSLLSPSICDTMLRHPPTQTDSSAATVEEETFRGHSQND